MSSHLHRWDQNDLHPHMNNNGICKVHFVQCFCLTREVWQGHINNNFVSKWAQSMLICVRYRHPSYLIEWKITMSTYLSATPLDSHYHPVGDTGDSLTTLEMLLCDYWVTFLLVIISAIISLNIINNFLSFLEMYFSILL